MFCELNLDQYDGAIVESISRLAFEAVEEIINSRQGEDADHAFRTLRRGSSLKDDKRAEKYGELLSMLLTKSWPKRTGEANISSLDSVTVEFLLSWNPMTGYLKFFGDESGRGSILTPEGQETLSMAKSLLSALVERISGASITVKTLKLLQQYKDRFAQLLHADISNTEEAEETVKSLNQRIEELLEFQSLKEKLMSFVHMCDLISPVNVTTVKRNVEEDVSLCEIRQLCERKSESSVVVTSFELSPVIGEVLPKLHVVQQSVIFQGLWAQHGKRAQTARKNNEALEKDLSISKVVECVWKPAFDDWNQVAVSTFDGSLSLRDVDKFFDSYKDKKDELVQELFCILKFCYSQKHPNDKLKTVAEERAAQMQQYQQIHRYVNAAETIWEFKEAMGFTGDFKIIEDLHNQLSTEFKMKPLNTIGKKFSEAGRALACLDVNKSQCLKKVMESKRLVDWLRITIKSTQELKVLVDLALISSGESDMETDRISHLHTSCLGFAPLIFDLKETEGHEVNFDRLMAACEPVWNAVKADEGLPQKLFDTSRHLEWLQTVKESHGSVAMTSIVQAKMINSSGVYVVGRLIREQDFHEEDRISLDQVVRLTVPPKRRGEDGSHDKIYSLDELKDLQSKLMLIAGKAEKGKEEVDTFVKNLEGIMRLATAYINLLESGFVHRMHWCQEFHCSSDQRVGESIAQELARVSTDMEDCYSIWKKKVGNARKEYRELNFFTTQQLMLLRKELASACHRSQLHVENLQVFTLLESVRPSLDSVHLNAAIQRAFKDTDLLEQGKGTSSLPSFTMTPRKDNSNSRELSCQNNNDIERAPSMVGKTSQAQSVSAKKPKPKGISKIRRFINAAEDQGYSEQVALCALASLGVDAEEDDLLLWCLDESDDADLESLYDEAINNPVIAREINMEETAADQENEFDGNSRSVDDSVGGSFQLPLSFSEQEENRDEDNEAVISEYLTLSQLGLILRELAMKDKGSKPRTFPAFLKRGRPNLMLVPKVDVFATVLALYMHDKDQLLPSQEEVLICSPDTTTEEIELLWRRATGDLEGRFYCLINADQLDFSVSKQAVDLLDALTKGLAGKTGEHYGLVVICSSENEDRANIVAALDQHRVAAPPCPSAGVVQSYLKRQFRIPPPQYGYINKSKITWNPAGFLDPEKLSVRVVSSSRGGLGKTLFVRRLTDQLPNLVNNDMVLSHSPSTSLHVTVPLHGNSTDSSMLVDSLLPHEVRSNDPLSRVFHLDVSPSVRRGLDTLLFNLLVLGSLCDKMGRLWRKRNSDLYIIEITTATPLPTGFSREEENARYQERQRGVSSLSRGPFYDFLPTISCTSPRTVSCNLQAKPDPNDFNPRMDDKEFKNPHFQRVYQYLKLSKKGENMDNFTFVPGNIDNDQKTCLALLLSNCGIPDPSWSELRHFVSFLNSQLRDCEESVYCDMKLMRAILAGPNVLNLEGFRSFAVRFMIQMSRDFATPSLTDENTVFFAKDDAELERKEIEQFKLRRSWESSPHPYLFFNEDHITMTFLGFSINSNGDLVDPQTNRILEKGLMPKNLRIGLQAQRVDFGVNTDNWKKAEKIMKLCSVIGAQWINRNPNFDPDPAYELTTDNVKKIMAIHMRFRCNIPVIVMGETGCGKTRLIRYMCGLQAGPKPGPRNMLLVKVHGGTTYEDIEAKVKQAEKMAQENQEKNIDTVLFFDEANTTEALSMIKEVMVDRTIRGRRIGLGLERLQFIAACNPYRRHTDEMIYKLESAGLGYHVKTEESDDRLGHIPLRHLVYRVHTLPGSMRPLIWDFGQLKHQVEGLYTNQIVRRYILHERKLPGDSLTVRAVASVLASCQKYMRDQSDECSFVSLRDVERAMQVMVWFYKHVDILGRLMRNVINEQRREEGDDSDEEDDDFDEQELIHPMTRALVLAIGVCYHAKLQDRRQDFRKLLAQRFEAPCALSGGEKQILREISSCQRAMLNQLKLGPNIARNTALSENVFMMVVCIELRIPLFVVGKPGSSKSLAKTVVADNMQGDAARSELFRTFKQVHMASYQCSPLSTPDGIVGTFRQCRKLQERKNLDRFVSVVVLDEVGLAEDSPLMPLKTLHPLLEDDVTSSDDVIETEEKPQRVAFIGISNWALDPAKMNRGIMLSREVPGLSELVESALGICSTDPRIKNLIQLLIPPLANGYAKLYKEQKDFETLKRFDKEEFFGLRDFYSLIKMVYAIAAKSGQRPGWNELEHAIKRNFGGLTERKPVEIFKRQMANIQDSDDNPDVRSSTTIRLIKASLAREDVADQTNFSENRYLLILTENYAALRIIQQQLLRKSDDAVVIFGSSFPSDQEYTQICRNINRIKVCMETGRTVILLNLESLYESLYDALNQYYVYLGGQKYVDLGLGTHRVKCRVHDDFKLIVIAEKEVVYNSFPIPLINRLEKHLLVTSTSLTSEQMWLVEKLQNWVNDFAEVTGSKKRSRKVFSIGDSFVGFHEDTIPSVVMQVCNDFEEEREGEGEEEEEEEEEVEEEEDDSCEDETEDPWENKIVRRCKNMLLEMATPDAIARLPASGLKAEAKVIWNVYFHEQQHSSLAAFVSHMLKSDKAHLKKRRQEGLLVQITTHSRLLSKNDLSVLCNQTGFCPSTVDFMTLQQIQTEQQFRSLVRFFFERLGGDCPGILITQCDSGDDNFNLIAGARHILMEERNNAPELLNLPKIEPVHIVLVVQLPRISGGCRNFVSFQGGKWMSVHIDELRPPGGNTSSIEHLIDRPISELFRDENPMQPETGKKAQMLAVDLLRNSVQAAACRVDNEAGTPDRSTQRIELLLQLLPENFEGINDEMTFADVLVQRTYNLLKESESTAYSANQWLYAEALSGTGVQEWGTFRKALWKRVYSSVVPILAEIIALADTDSNLDLMKNSSSWLPTLWLRILANPNISELSYSKIISPVTNTVRERVQVLGSGAGGHTFQCMFPFSFLIKQQVDKLLQSASSVAATTSVSLVKCLRDHIKTSETGSLFDGLCSEYLQALSYLSDYVHMVYKPSSTNEHELVCEAVISSARELELKKDEDGNELLHMALIHLGHSRIQSRLRCFAKLVQAQPNVVQRCRENCIENKSEVLLDVVALRICLEEFNPSDEVLLDPDSARKWCDRVLSIRQTVEVMMGTERFQAATEATSNYGDKAKMLIGVCRSMWQRAGAVRLFVEHVTWNEQNSGFNSENVLRLWTALGEETNFSSLASLKSIEKFLISYSEEARKRGDESEYRRRCNAFFMELVSLFCFGESSRGLEEDALSHLMRYVIGQQSTQTWYFSLFPDYRIDPTAVVRSFLLQQLLRSSQSFVKEHLDVFLQGAQSLQPESQHIKEVCFLCVQCMEDNLISRYQAKIFDSKLTFKLKHAKKICDEVFTAFEIDASYTDEPFQMNASVLESVAKGRYVLTLVANYLYEFNIEGESNVSNELDVKREFKNLLESVKRLFLESASTTPQFFLVRQLVRRYGFDYVRTLGKFQELQWVIPSEARQQEEDVIQDRFVVHEKQYRDVREGLAKGIISGNIEDFADAMTESEVVGVYKDVLLLLALYREVTLVNASSQRQNVSDKVKEKLIGFLRSDGNLSTTAQPFAMQLLQNDQGGDFRELKVFPGKSPQDHTLAEIIIHASIALQCVGSGALTEPLYVLMTDPRSMMNSYLPTIPEDNFLDCIKVIGETMKEPGRPGEWYECGNCKYPYFIGECSKPMEKSQCPDCGRVLGGGNHRFLGEWAVAKRQDRTKTGHALGDPGSRLTVAEPQRDLSPILCSLVRIVMHAAMVMGASRNAQATAQLITPSCQPDLAAEFLWRHLQRDLDLLGRALELSVDDAALTVHLVLRHMILLNGGQTVNAHDMRLSTRESRRQWERDFSSVVIAPVVRQLDQNLQKALKLLMEDERFGSDPLVRQLYEFEEQIEDLSHGLKPMTRSLWKYRRQVTIEQLGNALQQATESTDHSHKVLSAFLKQEHKLRCVQFLPDIVRLQQLLMDRFHRRMDRTDAEKFTIREFLQKLQRGPVKDEFNGLIQRFKLAWNSCRSFLGEQGRLRVPEDLCNITMDNDCSIAMLLPSTKGMSVCSMALLFFLVNTNDEFLGIYRSATNQESPLERIPMTDVTLSQLIAYDPERDLLPLILAHCNYSLEVGGETFVQYDWTALERQLTDRFLKGRPFVDFKEERFAFSRDTRDDNVFASRADKIPQEAVSRAIEAQVISDLRSSLSDVCDVLSSLDIAIGFLSSSGGQRTMPLKWYLHEVLKLPNEDGLKSLTAEQHCNLSHILAMWRLMALEKAKIKSRNNQEPFEEMSDVFKVKLSSSVAGHLNRVLRKIDMEHFLPQLLEMILLKVKHADENVADMSFREYLELYLADKDLDEIPGMKNIPENVHMKHLQAVWSSAVQLCNDFRGGSQHLLA
ncbi:LOW QUALITY PROTEIN: E3 ubiquitin-protein ligase rnf213-alpha-like [Montipora capricornis]|uniref:LOW QUALITY PROTEIN: E3 ubiquitin-protein ligase rnf213-alpha-like n=1 Tax=Montipora capricornis TaxID=246305 RepID=UPI0035F14710